ncbi:hypothetical protein [Acuticoccus sp.]|uniref:hypothetical protein n=1 Tax=Acuticoccus sp. TaxID=1904378 RepID=UPI003B523F44
MLTALVSATVEGVGQNHDFRDRLGTLLGGERFRGVAKVNQLWEELALWCNRRAANGEPTRVVRLPDPGNANRIGRAVNIAFPNWRDRIAFARILRKLAASERATPYILTQALERPGVYPQIPAAVQAAFDDFRRRLDSDHRMLQGHRFWSLVQSI